MNTPPIATGGRAVNPAVDVLAAIPRWVCWKYARRKGKMTKPPFQVGGKDNASSTDPKTWSTFDACWSSAFVDGAAHGIGIVLDGSDDLMAADLDDCLVVPEDGTLTVEAAEIVQRLNSYTEISPSGRGLRVFFRGTMPDNGRKVAHLELYRAERFLTVTGAHFPGTPETINCVAPEVLAELLASNYTKPNGGAGRTAEHLDSIPEPTEELRERFKAALRADAQLRAIWKGEAPRRKRPNPLRMGSQACGCATPARRLHPRGLRRDRFPVAAREGRRRRPAALVPNMGQGGTVRGRQ
jgi:hypothetical protein